MEALTKTNFANQAEDAIQTLIEKDRNGRNVIKLTTSKIRNILSMTNVLYAKSRQWKQEELDEDILRDVQYLKMRIAYEAGREPEVKKFVEKASIMQHIKDIGKSKTKLMLFCNYIESLVAYHRFYGGR